MGCESECLLLEWDRIDFSLESYIYSENVSPCRLKHPVFKEISIYCQNVGCKPLANKGFIIIQR